MLYYLRTTPAELIRPFITEFDQELRDAFEEVVGCSLSEAQWDQAALGIKFGGFGLCRAGDVASAAYIASRARTLEDCVSIDAKHVWDDGKPREGQEEVIGEWLGGTNHDYDGRVAAGSCIERRREAGDDLGNQGDLTMRLNRERLEVMKVGANELEVARLNAVSAPRAGLWLDAPPCREIGLRLTNAEVRSRAARRLGLQVCDEGPCLLFF